jgi:hypothetical protein
VAVAAAADVMTATGPPFYMIVRPFNEWCSHHLGPKRAKDALEVGSRVRSKHGGELIGTGLAITHHSWRARQAAEPMLPQMPLSYKRQKALGFSLHP